VRCGVCNPQAFSEHSRLLRFECRFCAVGRAYCEHRKLRRLCRDCGGGSGLCAHGVIKFNCRECGNGWCKLHSK